MKTSRLVSCVSLSVLASLLVPLTGAAQQENEPQSLEEKERAEKEKAEKEKAEKTKLSGKVLAKGSGAPIKDALVIEDTNRENSVRTSKEGEFSIDVPLNGKLIFRANSYEELTVQISEGKLAIEGEIFLEPAPELSSIGVIRARRKTEVSQQSLQREEMERIPGTGGDAVRSLQTLPSVIPAGRGSSDITVRGSAPGDNKYFLDRMEVPFVFHLGGLGSVVPTRMLEGIDLYPGGFSSLYNDAIGGVVQLRTENKIPERFSGRAELSLIQTSLYMEGNMLGSAEAEKSDGPTSLNNQENQPNQENLPKVDERVGYRAGFRRTYLEVWTPLIKKAGGESLSIVTLPQATDYQFVLNGNHASGTWQGYLLGAANRLKLAVATSLSDNEEGKSNFSLFNYFQTTGFRYNSNLGNGWGLTLAPQQRYLKIDQQFFDNKVKVVANKFALESILDKRINSAWSMSFGVRPEFERTTSDVDAIQLPAGGPGPFFDPDTAPRSAEKRTNNEFSGYGFVDSVVKPTKSWTLNPGIALLKGNKKNLQAVDPRFSTRYALNDVHAVKASWGVYSQNPAPQFVSNQYGNPLLKTEKSIHYVAGWETKIDSDWETDLQIYYKKMYDLAGNATKDLSKKYENNLNGRSRGAEIYVKRNRTGRYTGWVSYSYSKSERQDPLSGKWRTFRFDKPHSFNLVSAYKLTGAWEIGGKFQYQSGDVETTIPGGRYNQGTGRFLPINRGGDGTVEANDERLPAFYQLDLRTDYEFLFNTWKLGVFMEVLNATNRQNVVGRNYSEDFSETVYVTGTPIIPNLGLIANF